MLPKWRIRNKLLVCGVLLLVLVGSLSAASFYGLYAYRGLVKGLSGRSTELPLAAELSQQVSDLRVTLSGVRSRQDSASLVGHAPLDNPFLREQFRMNLKAIETTIGRYRGQLELNAQRDPSPIQDNRQEREALSEIEQALERIHHLDDDSDWMFDEVKTVKLAAEVEKLHQLAGACPASSASGCKTWPSACGCNTGWPCW